MFNVGAWNEKTVLSFFSNANTPNGSTIREKGNTTINADSLDNLISDGKADFIKMDIEGAELNALIGAKNLIQKNNPILAICAYHRQEDLITIPQYIKKLNSNYKIYLRKHNKYEFCDLVLYAIP